MVGCDSNFHAVIHDSASTARGRIHATSVDRRSAPSINAEFAQYPAIQRPIEVLFYGTMGGLLDLLTGRDASLPLDRAALELAAIEYPEIEADAFVGLLDSYAAELQERVGDPSDGKAYVLEANRYVFDELGFRGNTADYYDPKNSCLNEVLTARTGIPITLSLVYMEIARRLGRPVTGIGLPGHFIVRYDDGRYSAFIDPFHGGRQLDSEDCFALSREVSQVEIEPDRRWLAPVSKRDLMLRMLRNLSGAYTSRGQTDKAINVLSLLIHANPDSPEEYRQRGILQTQAGRLAAAKQDLARYLDLAKSPDERERAKAQVHQIQHWIASMN
jgi:regulator of sirC expression with transglutaminase-like and TPR domain